MESDQRLTRIGRRTVLLGGLLAAAGLAGATGCAARPSSPAAPASVTTATSAAAVPVSATRVASRVVPGKQSGSFVSAARKGATCGWTLAVPAGATGPLRVLISLHGRWAGHADTFEAGLQLDQVLAQSIAAGTRPFAIASVDGGDTYWHARANGDDAAAMVRDEFIPMLAGLGLDTARVGLLGWSMGGYGALWLASQLGPQRVAAVAAESPALWLRAGEAAPGAFDDAADFAAHNVFDRRAALTGIPLRIDCGTSDPFYSATRTFVAGLPAPPAGGFQSGNHNMTYWRAMAPAQLSFIGAHLPA